MSVSASNSQRVVSEKEESKSEIQDWSMFPQLNNSSPGKLVGQQVKFLMPLRKTA